jgi:hypothetical protein
VKTTPGRSSSTQQTELCSGQGYFFIPDMGAVPIGVHVDLSDHDRVAGFGDFGGLWSRGWDWDCARTNASEHGLHTADQLSGREGLGEIVVTAELESEYAIDLFAFTAEKDHRHG